MKWIACSQSTLKLLAIEILALQSLYMFRELTVHISHFVKCRRALAMAELVLLCDDSRLQRRLQQAVLTSAL